MDVRLVAYRDTIIASGITSFEGVGSYSSPTTICYFINSVTFPAGQVPCDIFRVGTKVYNSSSQFVGTVVCCDGCSQPAGPCIPANWYIRIAVPANNATLNVGEAVNVARSQAFNLDLQDSPNISLNFQFADTKEPEKRKSKSSNLLIPSIIGISVTLVPLESIVYNFLRSLTIPLTTASFPGLKPSNT